MARKGIASIGVDFGARDIRAVEVSTDGRTIKHYASTLLPAVGLDKGIPIDPGIVAETLRGLFKDLNTPSRKSVIGLPAQAVTTRVLDIPQVPDAELKAILDGEVQHYGIVRGFGGMFDYVRLAKSAGDKESEPQALVMACEGAILNSVRDGSERARVEKVAIEPGSLGLIRVCAVHHSSPEPAMFVAVTGDIAEIAVVVESKLRIYRRVELTVDSADDSFLRGMQIESEDAVPAFLRAEAGTGVGNQLVIELKRTLEYVKREFDKDTQVAKIVLAVSQPKEAALADLLAEHLDLPVETAKAPLPGDDGFRYATAYGLAIGSTFPDLGIPLFDLSPFDPVEAENQRQQKILATSLVASIIVILASVGSAFFFGKQANEVEHHVEDDKVKLAELHKTAVPEAMARQAKLEAYRALSVHGVPVPQVVDSLTSVLDAKTGIHEIDINGNQIKVAGEAVDEASMIKTLDRIRTQQGFRSAFIESFDQRPEDERKVVKFRMTAQLGANPGAQP